MKRLVAMLSFLILATGASAQVYEPFPVGPGVEEKATIIRCMPNVTFAALIKNKNLHLIAMQVVKSNDKAIKIISGNPDGDVVVANIMPDETVCILDILQEALMTQGLIPPPSEHPAPHRIPQPGEGLQ